MLLLVHVYHTQTDTGMHFYFYVVVTFMHCFPKQMLWRCRVVKPTCATLIPLSAAKVGSYLTYFQSKVVNLTYFQSKVIYFGSKVIGSENTAACSPSVSICNRAVGSWTKSSDLVQKIPLPFLFSLPSHEYDNVGRIWQFLWWSYDDRKLMTMKIFLWCYLNEIGHQHAMSGY